MTDSEIHSAILDMGRRARAASRAIFIPKSGYGALV